MQIQNPLETPPSNIASQNSTPELNVNGIRVFRFVGRKESKNKKKQKTYFEYPSSPSRGDGRHRRSIFWCQNYALT